MARDTQPTPSPHNVPFLRHCDKLQCYLGLTQRCRGFNRFLREVEGPDTHAIRDSSPQLTPSSESQHKYGPDEQQTLLTI